MLLVGGFDDLKHMQHLSLRSHVVQHIL
jgi:hypothetical protein